MIKYKVGYNFDSELVEIINELNNHTAEAQIDSVYASISIEDELTARPKYKLPEISLPDFSMHIAALHKIGVQFIYPLNASYIGNKRQIEMNYSRIVSFVKNLEDIGVDGIIVTHPLIAEIVYKNTNLSISMSSIANIFSMNQIGFLKDMYDCNSFCLSPYFNRKIQFLKSINQSCKSINCDIELIVNELCGLGYNDSSFSPCIYRESCFDCHSQNKLKQDALLLNGYPQTLCTKNRLRFGPEFWAKTMVIRPEDIKKYYERAGIQRFKITGRTASTGALSKVLTAYMTFDYSGDLSKLWYMGENKATINNKHLDGFIDHWFDNPYADCDCELCGITCKYCNSFFSSKK